jgi:hypothetical protein
MDVNEEETAKFFSTLKTARREEIDRLWLISVLELVRSGNFKSPSIFFALRDKETISCPWQVKACAVRLYR